MVLIRFGERYCLCRNVGFPLVNPTYEATRTAVTVLSPYRERATRKPESTYLLSLGAGDRCVERRKRGSEK